MRKRLDLTVIGTAVNAASRLETLTKAQKRTVLLSKAFIDMAKFESDLETSSFRRRGLSERWASTLFVKTDSYLAIARNSSTPASNCSFASLA